VKRRGYVSGMPSVLFFTEEKRNRECECEVSVRRQAALKMET